MPVIHSWFYTGGRQALCIPRLLHSSGHPHIRSLSNVKFLHIKFWTVVGKTTHICNSSASLNIKLIDLHIYMYIYWEPTTDKTSLQVLITQWDLAPFLLRHCVYTMHPLSGSDSMSTVGQKLTWKLNTKGHFLLSNFKLWPSGPSFFSWHYE